MINLNFVQRVALNPRFVPLTGTPWMPMDEGKARYLTQWEQLDQGMQFTATKKFLTVIPIVLFFLARYVCFAIWI